MIDFNDPATRKKIDKIVVDTIRKYSTDTVYFKDKDSKFIWNSLGHIQQLGVRSQEEAFGKSDFDYFPKDFAQSARETELTIMQTGTPIINMIEELTLDDENVRYYNRVMSSVLFQKILRALHRPMRMKLEKYYQS